MIWIKLLYINLWLNKNVTPCMSFIKQDVISNWTFFFYTFQHSQTNWCQQVFFCIDIFIWFFLSKFQCKHNQPKCCQQKFVGLFLHKHFHNNTLLSFFRKHYNPSPLPFSFPNFRAISHCGRVHWNKITMRKYHCKTYLP